MLTAEDFEAEQTPTLEQPAFGMEVPCNRGRLAVVLAVTLAAVTSSGCSALDDLGRQSKKWIDQAVALCGEANVPNTGPLTIPERDDPSTWPGGASSFTTAVTAFCDAVS